MLTLSAHHGWGRNLHRSYQIGLDSSDLLRQLNFIL